MTSTNRIDPPAVVARIDRTDYEMTPGQHAPDCDCHGCAVRRTWRHGPGYAWIDTAALDRVTPDGRDLTRQHRKLHSHTLTSRTYDAMSAAIGSAVTYDDATRAADASALALRNITSL